MSGTATNGKAASAATETAAPKDRRRNLRPWVRGQSGNPTGGSRSLAEVRSLARDYGREALEKLVTLMRGRSPKIALAAAREILDRAYGRPQLEIAGPGGGPIPLGVVPGVPITPELAAAAYDAVIAGTVPIDSVSFARVPTPALERLPPDPLPIAPASSAAVPDLAAEIEAEAVEGRAATLRTWEECAK